MSDMDAVRWFYGCEDAGPRVVARMIDASRLILRKDEKLHTLRTLVEHGHVVLPTAKITRITVNGREYPLSALDDESLESFVLTEDVL